MSAISIEEPRYAESDGTLLPAHVARMLESALMFCVSRSSRKTEQGIVSALRGADARTHDCFRHQLARQVAEYLRNLDDNVTGAYTYSYGDGEEEGADRSCVPTSSIGMILTVKRRTAALNAAVAALDELLVAEYARMITPVADHMISLLDIQIVDEQEVEQGTGFAVVLRSAFTPPTRVWPA